MYDIVSFFFSFHFYPESLVAKTGQLLTTALPCPLLSKCQVAVFQVRRLYQVLCTLNFWDKIERFRIEAASIQK